MHTHPEPSAASDGAPWGVNVAGFLRSEMGIGEAARSVVVALDAVGTPLLPVHGSYVPGNRQGVEFLCARPEAAPFPINLICINPEELPIFLQDAGPGFTAGRYTIGFWWWEVAAFPERWIPTFDLVDEVWVGTEHVARNLQPVSPVPVTKMRIPVMPPTPSHLTREQLGLPGGFLFLFMFDFNSIFERKNPLAVVEAFIRAFSPDDGAVLVIKSINHGADPDNYARLLSAAELHPGVHVVSRYMSREAKDALVASCDCYVSLHRAEGFALTPAEAMYLGKPVVATRYSGNLEFMSDENSFLVDYSVAPIRVSNPLYPPDGTWADPSPEHAATLMRQVFDDPRAARRRAAIGAQQLQAAFSATATGQAMESRLRAIHADVQAGSWSPRIRRPASDPGPPIQAWRNPLTGRLSLTRTLTTARTFPGQRRALAAAVLGAARELGGEWLDSRRRPLVKPRTGTSPATAPATATATPGGHDLETWALLARIRRQEAAADELRSQIVALERRLAGDGN